MSRHLHCECLKLEKVHPILTFWNSPEVDNWRTAQFMHLSWLKYNINVALLRLTCPSAEGELQLSGELQSQTGWLYWV